MHTSYLVPQYVVVSVLSVVLSQTGCRTPPGDCPPRAHRPPPPNTFLRGCAASESRPPPPCRILRLPPHLPFFCVMHCSLWPSGHFLLRHAYTYVYKLRIPLSTLRIHKLVSRIIHYYLLSLLSTLLCICIYFGYRFLYSIT
jgi:hypothetical protein